MDEIRTYWCLGMYASASTWLFNVVRGIAGAAYGDSVRTHFWSGTGNFAGFDQAGTVHIVKSHEISDSGTVAELARRSTRIFITIRDPRDAVGSLMLYHQHDFEKALGLVHEAGRQCVRTAQAKNAEVFLYENGFFNKRDTVTALAGRLGVSLDAAVYEGIFKSHKRDEVERYIATLPKRSGVLIDRASGDLLDPATHWHTHHAGRTGEVGRWKRMLSAAQVEAVKARMADCFKL